MGRWSLCPMGGLPCDMRVGSHPDDGRPGPPGQPGPAPRSWWTRRWRPGRRTGGPARVLLGGREPGLPPGHAETLRRPHGGLGIGGGPAPRDPSAGRKLSRAARGRVATPTAACPTPAACSVPTARSRPSTARSTCSTWPSPAPASASRPPWPRDPNWWSPRWAGPAGRPAARRARPVHLLRPPVPRALPDHDPAGGHRGGGAGGLHRRHRTGPLGTAAPGPGRGERGLRHRVRPGRGAAAGDAAVPRPHHGGGPMGHGGGRADRADARGSSWPSWRCPRWTGAERAAGAGTSPSRGVPLAG